MDGRLGRVAAECDRMQEGGGSQRVGRNGRLGWIIVNPK